jgi:LEA14-like dessication related protein
MLIWLRSTALLVIALLVFTSGLSGCRTLARAAFKEPIVTLRDVRLTGVSFTGGALEVVLGVHNPNDYRLDATRLTWKLLVDSAEVGSGSLDNALSVRAGDSTVVTLPVRFTFAALGAVARQLQGTGGVDYRLVGDLTVATPVGSVVHPYDRIGRFTFFSGPPGPKEEVSHDR